MLTDIVVILWICPHSNLRMTTGAFEVKAKHLDSKVIDVMARFFAHVELCADVEEVSTCITPDTHGKHHSYTVLLSC